MIARSLELARDARERGDHPFGALIARGEDILIEDNNRVNSEQDPTQHAESRLVSAASRKFDLKTLGESTLYTSTEPCAMCAGAIFWAGVRKVVYGCPAETLGNMSGGGFVIPSREIFERGKYPTEVIGPILEKESIEVHEGFWD
jgi:tRNA(Arg) A34 adenosine deaminase TadA